MRLRIFSILISCAGIRPWLCWLALGALTCDAFELSPSIGTNGLFRVQLQSAVDSNYLLYRGATLTNINLVVTVFPGTGSIITLTDTNPPTAPAMFYRVAASPKPLLFVNEIDYDQKINPDGASFIELYNSGSNAVLLENLAVVLVNGADNQEYRRFNLGAAGMQLAAGGYLVIRNSGVVISQPALTIDVTGDFLQNGPDAVAVMDLSTGTVIDALSYEGSITMAAITGLPGVYNLNEGTPTSAFDDGNASSRSMIRFPNGIDTNNANSDWASTSSLTPGAANQ